MAQSRINGELIWVEYYNKCGESIYIITSKAARDLYFLYDTTKTPPKKVGKAKTPIELEKKYISGG